MTTTAETSFGRFFLPGPTEVRPEVLEAMLRPMIAHRGSAMVELLAGIDPPLKRLFRTARRVVIGSCSATGFMEMAARCGIKNRALCLVGGAFGERFAAIAQACGHDVVRLDVRLGETVEPDMLRDALKRTEVDAVTMVHSETSTGALAPLDALAPVVREFPDVLCLVDAVTSIAGSPVETDACELDFVFTGSQKALALPPGLALGVASDRFLERAKQMPARGAYLDAVAYAEAFAANQPTNTPAVSILFALEKQLARIEEAGGIEQRWERHRRLQQVTEEWVGGPGGALGYQFLPRSGRRSWTVSCLRVPDGMNGRAIAKALTLRGWTIGSGYGSLKEASIRIGHMGDHTEDELRALLEEIEKVRI